MAEINHYTAFGITISSDLVMPELQPLSSQNVSQPAVWIRRGDSSRWPSRPWSRHGTPSLRLAPGECRLELEGLLRLRAWDGCRLHWQRWDDSVSDRDVRTFAVTCGLGALAIQRGMLVLHGTALESQGQAILLLGHPASGKSTLAWCLLQRGWRLLSSEFSVVDEEGLIWPGLQQLKLWDDAARQLGVDWAQTSPVRRGLKRYALRPPVIACAERPLPLRCLYTLCRDKGAAPVQQEDEVKTLAAQIRASRAFSQQGSLLSLRNQAFHPRMYRGMGLEAGLFTQAGALARRSPLHRLQVPEGIKAMASALEHLDLLDPASLQVPVEESGDG